MGELHENQTQTNTEKKKSSISRVEFISMVWKLLLGVSSILGLAGLWRFFSYRSASARPVIFDLGPVENLPRDALLNITEAQAVIRPTPEGFEAYSLVCPHLGCLVEPSKDGYYCPCHGSRFELDGTVVKGPASDPMSKLELRISEEGHLLLDTSSVIG